MCSLQGLGRQGGWGSVLCGQGLKLLWVCWVQVGGAVGHYLDKGNINVNKEGSYLSKYRHPHSPISLRWVSTP